MAEQRFCEPSALARLRVPGSIVHSALSSGAVAAHNEGGRASYAPEKSHDARCKVDELIRDLVEHAGLSDQDARAAAEVIAKQLRDEEKRTKLIAATAAITAAVQRKMRFRDAM